MKITSAYWLKKTRIVGHFDPRRTALVCIFALSLVVAISSRPATAGTLFYGGDWWGNGSGNGTTTNAKRSDFMASVYQNFVVPTGTSWQVSSLFVNNLSSPNALTIHNADWTVRSGVSLGNGGAVVASGANASVTQTPTGRGYSSGVEYTVTVPNLSVSLTSGTYWMNITPIISSTVTGNTLTYATWTFGAQAIGTNISGENYLYVEQTGAGVQQNFTASGGPYSFGVVGAAGPPGVPEIDPAGFGSVAALIAGALGLNERRRTRAKAG